MPSYYILIEREGPSGCDMEWLLVFTVDVAWTRNSADVA